MVKKAIQLIDWGDDEEEEKQVESNKMPKQKNLFVQQNSDKLLNFEVEEIKNLNQDLIYFVG